MILVLRLKHGIEHTLKFNKPALLLYDKRNDCENIPIYVNDEQLKD